MFTGYSFDHKIYSLTGDNWRYTDNNELLETANPRKCPKCGLYPTSEGHDPCIANLPGVIYACCGHGISGTAYVMLTDGTTIRGKFDEKYLSKHKE